MSRKRSSQASRVSARLSEKQQEQVSKPRGFRGRSRRPDRDTEARIKKALKVATKQFPDADRFETTLVDDGIVVHVWDEGVGHAYHFDG